MYLNFTFELFFFKKNNNFWPTVEEMGWRDGEMSWRRRTAGHSLTPASARSFILYAGQPGELQEKPMRRSHVKNPQPFELCCNIYFHSLIDSSFIYKVTFKHQAALASALKPCLKNDGWSVARMSLLAKECGVRDSIQCHEARGGKWGETSVNNEVKVIWG